MARISFGADATMPPAGQAYPLRCSKAIEKESRAGTPMFKVSWEITAGKFAGSRIDDFIMLGGRAAKWHAKKLKVILELEKIEDGQEIQADDLLYREVWGWAEHNEYNNEVYLRVDGKAGPDGCGYASKDKYPWPEDGATGEADNRGVANSGEQQDFSDIPF